MITKDTFAYIAGFTDNKTECECCGKRNLKGTYVCIDVNNEDFYFGSSCIQKLFGFNKKTIELKVKEYTESKLNGMYISAENDFPLIFTLLNEVKSKYENNFNGDYEEIVPILKKLDQEWLRITKEHSVMNVPFYDNSVTNGFLYLTFGNRDYNFMNNVYRYSKYSAR